MGLSNSCFGWSNQVKYFASKSGYQVLVFDNRGVGLSDSPKGAYKTSEMAMDVVELLHQVGWVPKDEESNVESGKDATAGGATRRAAGINVVGVSMGGMIGLELVKSSQHCKVSRWTLTLPSARLLYRPGHHDPFSHRLTLPDIDQERHSR